MVIVLKRNIAENLVAEIVSKIEDYGFKVIRTSDADRVLLTAVGDTSTFDVRKLKVLEGVSDAIKISDPFKLASRVTKPENTIVRVKNAIFGTEKVEIIAGPCSIESEKQIFGLAKIVKESNVNLLRGGAFKPRTSPYSFQGLGEDGLKLMRDAANEFNLGVVTEVMQAEHVEMVYKYADMLQVGARNMQNYPLLKELAKIDKPILLKRGISATIEELLLSAEYLLSGGNNQVVLCERGIRTFEKYTRHTFDLSAIPVIKQKSHLPIIADPSHATGFRNQVPSMARAAIAAGADGIMIEIHQTPEDALSDGPQALLPNQYLELIKDLNAIATVIQRKLF